MWLALEHCLAPLSHSVRQRCGCLQGTEAAGPWQTELWHWGDGNLNHLPLSVFIGCWLGRSRAEWWDDLWSGTVWCGTHTHAHIYTHTCILALSFPFCVLTEHTICFNHSRPDGLIKLVSRKHVTKMKFNEWLVVCFCCFVRRLCGDIV